MYHYTYLLLFPDEMKYVGVHSTNIQPELDTCYLGSGRALPERTKDTCTKIILAQYPTRKLAKQAESEYIRLNKCVESDEYYNQRDWNFDKHGQTATTHENIASMQHKLKGRTEKTHEYIKKANEIRRQYVGENRTPAQIEGSKNTGIKQRGVSVPERGHKGTDNKAFKPWYYIDTDGFRFEIYNETKRDYAPKLGLTPRQLAHRFHYTNIDKPTKQGVCKGYIFGNIEN
jgi:hypothetical protein